MNKSILMIFFSILIVPNSLWASATAEKEASDSYASSTGPAQQLTPVKDEFERRETTITLLEYDVKMYEEFMKTCRIDVPATVSEKATHEIFQNILRGIKDYSSNVVRASYFGAMTSQGAHFYEYNDASGKKIDLRKMFSCLRGYLRNHLEVHKKGYKKITETHDGPARVIQKAYRASKSRKIDALIQAEIKKRKENFGCLGSRDVPDWARSR